MKLFNTSTKQKEEFIPLDMNKVKMYVCGPTVYNYIHIGNARPLIIFDTLRRFLEYTGYAVTFVQNFTDVDDKIINRSKEEGITAEEVAEKYINEFRIDESGLNAKKATYNPRVTENMDEIIEMIKTLIDKGNAYAIDGDVYFSTKSFKEYGKLCGQALEEKEAGARINVDDRKRDSMDFALWKAKKEGEPYWNSPWGKGRPGWHIECSVMAKKFLGETIDIHGGGQDLIFPHHENEKAQSECANGKQFARYWVHNGFINVENQKMSKSLNNFFTVREVSNEFDYEVIRFFMLSVHYRKPINFSREIMQQCKNSLERIYNFINNMKFMLEKAQSKAISIEENEIKKRLLNHKEEFINNMNDDINTADAVTAIFEIIRDSNTNLNTESSKEILEFANNLVKELTGVLGLLNKPKSREGTLSDEDVQKLVVAREEARKTKNWAEADKIRDELKSNGITLEDTPQGLRVVRK